MLARMVQSTGRRHIWLWVCLTGVLVVSEVAYIGLIRLDAINGIKPVVLFLAWMAVLFSLYASAFWLVSHSQLNTQRVLYLIIAGAALFRITMLTAGLPHRSGFRERVAEARSDLRGDAVEFEPFLLFDNDVWRYLWDGHVWGHGTNPYLYPPNSPALDLLARGEPTHQTDELTIWPDIRANINHPSVPTIYPPAAEALFRWSHWISPGSVLALKLSLLIFDALTALFLILTLRSIGRPTNEVLLYLWNPLVVKEVAGSAHVDIVVTAMLACTVYFVVSRRRFLAAISFGLAVLAKLAPVVLLPLVIRWIGWRRFILAMLVVGAGYFRFMRLTRTPFAGLLIFARHWQFNSGFFLFAKWAASAFTTHADVGARIAGAMALALTVIWTLRVDGGTDQEFTRLMVLVLGALIMFSATVMPWYVIWLLPPAIMGGVRFPIYLSAVVCLAMLVMIDGVERPAVPGVEFVLLAFLVWRELRRSHAGPLQPPIPNSWEYTIQSKVS